jgi:ABC-2 type transport system permease protein
MDVKNVSIAIYNQDNGKHGYEIIQRLVGSPTFTQFKFIHKEAEIKPIIDQQQAIAALTIPQDFSRKIEAGSTVSLQVILDGRRSTAAQMVNGYLNSLLQTYSQELTARQGQLSLPVNAIPRYWFNPNLLYIWFTVPSLICILSMLISLVITALSIARERELGTFDQLLVSPLTPSEILIGKTIPAIIIGMIEGILMWAAAIWIFKIPFYGSYLLMILSLLIFMLSIVGTGLFISALSKTQQQAILGVFIFMVPAITLSGYAAPIANMPPWLQQLTWINPLKHILIIVKGIFLKNMSAGQVIANGWPLLIISFVTLSIAGWCFKQRLE